MIPISIAPMMGYTDRHCRVFLRLVSPSVRLYTEMVTTGALLHGPAARLLAFHTAEHPVALQLGGSDPADLARCAEMGATAGYDEVNLNCGCPSDRVQRGQFGACLMLRPDLVAQCVQAMTACGLPVTVKCRTGVDGQDSPEFLLRFAEAVFAAGAGGLIVHARKCWLRGLSPHQNRSRPPLDYARVQWLKTQFPDRAVILNGGIVTAEQAHAHTGLVDGVMIGRAAYRDPWLLATLDPASTKTRTEVARAMAAYIQESGAPARAVTRHMGGLFHGQPGAKAFRRAMAGGDVQALQSCV
ncbi:MAG TPA: tRNA dihydrouridine(20/20a) synthase DusA [Rhodospirillaceae bacterium]|jgi:tRNA-dihydrouridine synthase A|nr:tRNA dihydrouridine(20/20a) synthase DusA [Alphaproteobacteria bacterium]HBH25956.1 tRNA dihydrouridine(20/20a) synthase DusA [Rhodospirillaceae bacterium]